MTKMWTTGGLLTVLVVILSCCPSSQQFENSTARGDESNVHIKEQTDDTRFADSDDDNEDDDDDSESSQAVQKDTTINADEITVTTMNSIQASFTNIETTFNTINVNQVQTPQQRRALTEIKAQIGTLTTRATSGQTELVTEINQMKTLQMDNQATADKIKSRQTPELQQKAERFLGAVQSIEANAVKLRDALKSGNELDGFDAVCSMVSGILAVIPTPHTKFAAVFFQVISMFIGLGRPSVDPYQNIYDQIKAAVDDIKNELDIIALIESMGSLAVVTGYYQDLAAETERYSEERWMRAATLRNLPTKFVARDELAVLSGRITHLIQQKRGQNAYNLFLAYVRIASIRDQVLIKMTELMPSTSETDLSSMNDYQEQLNREREIAFNVLRQLHEPDATNIFAVHYYYPLQHDDESKEIYKYVSKLSYVTMDGSGDTVAMRRAPVVEGTFMFESKSKADFFMYLVPQYTDWPGDWDQKVKKMVKPPSCYGKRSDIIEETSANTNATKRGMGGSLGDRCRPYEMDSVVGRKITLLDEEKLESKIKIENSNYPIMHATLTFTKETGRVIYVVSSDDPESKLDTTELYATTSSNPRRDTPGLVKSDRFKVIQIGVEGSNSVVVIGNAQGKNFVKQTDHWRKHCNTFGYNCQEPIFMKELPTGSGELDARYKFILKKVEEKKKSKRKSKRKES